MAINADKIARVRAQMSTLVQPISNDDAEADVVSALNVELRRTVAGIRYWDERILELNSTDDLVWGTTRKTYVGSGEWPGMDEVQEAQLNIAYRARFQERQHLLALGKLWVAAKLGEQRNALTDDLVEAVNSILSSFVVGLDQDPHDPKVRAAMREAIAAAHADRVAIEPAESTTRSTTTSGTTIDS